MKMFTAPLVVFLAFMSGVSTIAFAQAKSDLSTAAKRSDPIGTCVPSYPDNPVDCYPTFPGPFKVHDPYDTVVLDPVAHFAFNVTRKP